MVEHAIEWHQKRVTELQRLGQNQYTLVNFGCQYVLNKCTLYSVATFHPGKQTPEQVLCWIMLLPEYFYAKLELGCNEDCVVHVGWMMDHWIFNPYELKDNIDECCRLLLKGAERNVFQKKELCTEVNGSGGNLGVTAKSQASLFDLVVG